MTQQRAREILAAHSIRFMADISKLMDREEEYTLRQRWASREIDTSTFHGAVCAVARGEA